MLSVLVRSPGAAPGLNRASVQRVPRVVPRTSDAMPPQDRLLQTPVAVARGAGKPSPRISSGGPLSIGSFLYLGSVRLIGAGIVAIFFGICFSLLAPVAAGTMYGPAERAGPEAISPLPSLGDVEQPTFIRRASARENNL